jgi:DNA repair protein RecO (recombination protein O)
MDITTHALVLREVTYKEADKILTVLTPDYGKLTVSARGCRRKNSKIAAAAQLRVYSEMTLYERQGRYGIREASTEQLFWKVRQDVERLALASYFAEVTELVSQEDVPSPELLRLLLNTLYALDQLPEKPLPLIKSAFELKLMSLAGYEPFLDGCAVCGSDPASPMFHLREGVLHCAQCRQEVGEGISMPLSAGALSAMRHVVQGDPKRLFSFRLDEKSQKQMNDLCEAFLLTQLERGFHTLDFYKMIEGSGSPTHRI